MEGVKVINFRLSSETEELLSRIAQAEGKNRSEVIRDLIERGLAAGGYLPGVRDMDEIVRDTMNSILQPAVSRLEAISAKTAHI